MASATSRALSLGIIALLILCFNLLVKNASSFRISGSDDQDKPFAPYEKGFVGHMVDPSNLVQPTLNPGYEAHVAAAFGNISEIHPNRLRRCPEMVGPADGDDDDGIFYCLGKEFGYCDRRSGTCFCNEGYVGNSCESCAPTHIRVGSLCYPKQLCPNDCSGAGVCNYLSGRCQCDEFRDGSDCSVLVCTKYHRYCTHCNDSHCTACLEGYGVDEKAAVGEQCVSCSTTDPRCIDCHITNGTKNACLRCVDSLLLSIRRSGPRGHDPALPEDEITRELSAVFPYGSQDPAAFDEAEHYFVVDKALSPLNASTVACDQGLDLDASYTCYHEERSHVVCGNHGTVYFISPEYEVAEDTGFVRLTIARSGGGVGTVSVEYEIEHLTTHDSDLTSTAFYTTNRLITFLHGQVQQSFLITINDDRLMEQDECFSVSLSAYDGPVQLGNQQRTTVCIIDDDSNRTCSLESELVDAEVLRAIAGEPLHFSIQASSCSGQQQTAGGDEFYVIATGSQEGSAARGEAVVVYNDGGTYTSELILAESGKYDVNAYQLINGGLLGHYYNSALLTPSTLEKTRVDAALNFTWGMGPVSSFATDFASVRWEGVIKAEYSERYVFHLDVDDNVRFWIDGILLVDAWDDGGHAIVTGEHDLVKGHFHEVLIEYRDLSGNASAKLLWASPHTPKEIVPSTALFYKEMIKGSPNPLVVQSAATNALKSTASGAGLLSGVAGKEHTFVLTPRDEFGNLRNDYDAHDRLSGRDGFFGVATLIENHGGGVGSTEVSLDITYNIETYTYDAVYVPTISGKWLVNVTLSSTGLLGSSVPGEQIFGSPFVVETTPGVTFARTSLAYGGDGNCFHNGSAGSEEKPCSGIRNGLAGSESIFYIQALDAHRNKRDNGDDAWVIVLHNFGGAEYIRGTFDYEDNGVYKASVTPQIAGENSLAVTLDGIHIKGSPFTMNVRYDDLDAPTSSVVSSK